MEKNADKIKLFLINYPKKRRSVIYLVLISIVMFAISILTESISNKISIPFFVIGFILFLSSLVFININCRIKCPRCGVTFCLKGFYYNPFTQRCANCGLYL